MKKSGQKKRNKKSVVRYWCRSGRRRIYRSKNSFFLQKKLNLNTQRIPLQKWPH